MKFLGNLDGFYQGPGSGRTDREAPSKAFSDYSSMLLKMYEGNAELSRVLQTLTGKNLRFDGIVRICQNLNLIPAELSVNEVKRYLDRGYRNWLAGDVYVANPIPIPIHLFRAEEPWNGVVTNSPYNYWEAVLPVERIRLIPVPGTHLSMMEPPHIVSLGEALSHAMSQARKDTIAIAL